MAELTGRVPSEIRSGQLHMSTSALQRCTGEKASNQAATYHKVNLAGI